MPPSAFFGAVQGLVGQFQQCRVTRGGCIAVNGTQAGAEVQRVPVFGRVAQPGQLLLCGSEQTVQLRGGAAMQQNAKPVPVSEIAW